MTADKDGLQGCARLDFLDRINMMLMILSHTEDAEFFREDVRDDR